MTRVHYLCSRGLPACGGVVRPDMHGRRCRSRCDSGECGACEAAGDDCARALLLIAATGFQRSVGAATRSPSASMGATSAFVAPPAGGNALPSSVVAGMTAALRAALSSGIPGVEAAVVTDHGTWQSTAGVDGRGTAV